MPNSGCVLDQDDMEKSSTSSKPESPGARSVWSSDQDLMAHPRMHAHRPLSGQRLKRPVSRGRLKCCIAFLLLTTVCLLTACAFLLYSYIENLLMQKETCTTPECIRAASLIMTTMDTSADPCEDFYQFACGNFQREHPIPDTDFSEDWFTNRNHHAIHRVREYLEQNDTDDEPSPVHKARVMYRACIDIESLERLSLSPMIRFLEHLGLPGTPPLGAPGTDPDTAVLASWQEAIAHVKRHIDKDILLGFDVMADPVNNTLNRLSFGMPGDSSILPSHNEHSKVKRPPLRWLLARSDRRRKTAWHEYIVKTMNYILEYNNKTTAPLNASVHAAAKKIIEFEKKLISLKENFTSTDPTKDDLPRNMWVAELQKLTDKEVSSYALSQINWRKYIEVLFDGIDEVSLDLVDVDRLAVYNLDYILALVRLLADTPKDTIFLTVWWEVVFELAPHTSNYMRDLRTDFEEKTIGEVASTSRPTHCAYVAYKLLDVAVGTVDTKKSFLYDTKPKVIEMIDFIQESFITAVDSTTWIDKETKAAIKEKVNYIKRRIGFPEWMLDESEVEGYYDNLEMYEKTHLENMLTYLGHSVYSNFKDIQQYNIYNSTGFNPLEVNAAYSVTDNMIYIPLGMIQYPFFNLGLDVLNYGAIGSILGHELVHSLDTDGRRYDKMGNFRSWWTNQSIEAFSERVSCLVDKYSNYYIEDVDDWVDGNLTLGENIADNGGLRAALWGYHRRVARHGPERALPGLAHYTHDQLFFLAFANMWCENWSRQAMRWTLEGEHAPNYVRVMGTLSNSPEFGRTWSCPMDTEMNPAHKCHVW